MPQPTFPAPRRAIIFSPMDRRMFLGAAVGALAGAAGYGALVEPRLLELTRHALRLGREGAEPADARRTGRVVVQISDLHLKGISDLHARLAAAVDALEPDLLLLTGDTVDAHENLPLVGEFLALLRTGAPCVAVMGNWEHWGGVTARDLERALSARGGELLVNRSLSLRLGGDDLLLTGLDDWAGGRPDLPGALAAAVGPARERGHHILLSHCPIVRDLAAGAAPWMLSGHTHGGQVSLLGLHWLPRGSGRYVDGWYRDSLPHLYVSRGVGTSVVPVRIGARPEVAVFRVLLS